MISEPLSWLNPQGAVEEFGRMLLLQLWSSLRGAQSETIQSGIWKDGDTIIFPKLVPEFPPSRDILVETFIEGLPILEFAKQNAHDKKLLHQLCIYGISAVCKMIFTPKSLSWWLTSRQCARNEGSSTGVVGRGYC
jgi:predicted unusual protein kinase regulating ubiquinone biosynthesis (AarF/ABC1/UbiB family)